MNFKDSEFQKRYDNVRNLKPEDCPFCKLIDNDCNEIKSKITDVVFQDRFTFAFIPMDQSEGTFGRTLVIPKRHVQTDYQLSEVEALHIRATKRLIGDAIKTAFKAGCLSEIINIDAPQQSVGHAHYHITPILGEEFEDIVKKDFTIRTEGQRSLLANELHSVIAKACQILGVDELCARRFYEQQNGERIIKELGLV
jgi:diadenosine tetraphosphate (Ap4A) HIT family hydrolase